STSETAWHSPPPVRDTERAVLVLPEKKEPTFIKVDQEILTSDYILPAIVFMPYGHGRLLPSRSETR
ncbi:MAG: hypothetical protein OXC62_02285, partial [Aestuariivita sp.]|nr:hypothetical protein [Aestuariivita sp.]